MAFPTTGLRAYYKLDSNSNDNAGSSYNGTDVNTPTYTSGKISNALTLASASSQYVNIPTGVFAFPTNTYSINLWLKLTTTTGNIGIFMGTGGSAAASGINLYISSGALQHDKPYVVSLGYTWTADTNWHMWTFVGDGSGMRTYLDGNSTPVASNGNTGNITDPGASIPFGGYKFTGTLQAGWYLDGQLDEVGFWTTALSTSDISTLYNSGTGITYPDASASTRKGLALMGVGQ